MAYAYEDEEVQLWHPAMNGVPDFLLHPENYHVHAWNSFFEWVIWYHVLKLPVPPIEQWTDTAALACAMALPRSLGGCGSALKLPQNLQKNKRGYYLIRMLSIPNKKNGDPKLTQEMYQYCKDDVTTEREISKRLYELTPTERKVWELDQTINIRGIKVDKPAIRNALNVYAMAQTDLKGRLKELTGLDNPNSQKQFLEWLQDKGVSVENTQKATLQALLEQKDIHSVHNALRLKMSLSKTAPKKYQSMHDKIGGGTRLHGNVMYHGASTGRWSSTGVNLQNIARPTLDPDWCIETLFHEDLKLFEMTDTDPMEALSSSVRGMLIPDKGKKFIVGDYSSIEARALAWLAGQEDKLELFRNNGLIYETAASKIFPVYSVTDVTKEQRFLGKISELACGYQGGANAFMAMAKMYGINIERKRANQIKRLWRDANRHIVAFWEESNIAVMRAIRDGGTHPAGKAIFGVKNNFLMCRLPSGRNLYYYYPTLNRKPVHQFQIRHKEEATEYFTYHPAEYASLKQFYLHAADRHVEVYTFEGFEISFWGVDSNTRKFSKMTTYGGKLVENITQAVARDIMAESMLKLEDAGYPIVLTVHDEIISEVTDGTVEEFTNIMEEVPVWANGLPIKVETYEAKRYRK